MTYETETKNRPLAITIHSIAIYFPEEHRPKSVDCTLKHTEGEIAITILTSGQARLFNRVKAKKARNQEESPAEENHAYVLSDKDCIGPLEVVEAARKICKEKLDQEVSLNDFEILDQPHPDEIAQAFNQWKKLINCSPGAH